MRVTYRVLGPLEAAVDARPARLGGPRQRAVLAVLLLRAGGVVPAGVLIDEVWGEAPPETAVNLVQGYVSGLRKELGRDAIETRDPGYLLHVERDALDLRAFERLAAEGSAALSNEDASTAVRRLTEALGLWRGPALADVTADGVAVASAARLEDLRLAAQERLGEALIAEGRPQDAVALLGPLVAAHPLRETLLAVLMVGLCRAGQQADALAAYRSGRTLLVRELGIEPGTALRELEAAVLRQETYLTSAPGDSGGPGRAVPAGVETEAAQRGSVLVAALDVRSLPALLALAEPLAGEPDPRELLVATTVPDVAELASVVTELNRQRDRLTDAGRACRTAAFTSLTPGADLARLAAEQDAALLLVDAPSRLLEDGRLTALLERAPCDVAVLVDRARGTGPVLVAFAGADHDWAAVELGAWFVRQSGGTLRLVGALSGEAGRDASRLLANASLAVQRALGVATEPLLVEPSPEALVASTKGAGLVLVGLTERWRREGMGRARTALASAGAHPTLLVRRGLRPGGLAPRDHHTRFTWTIGPHG